jgi:hypothetical protein
MTVAALPSSPFMQRPANTESAASVHRTSDIIITKSKKQNALEGRWRVQSPPGAMSLAICANAWTPLPLRPRGAADQNNMVRSVGTSPNRFNTTASSNTPTSESPVRLKATAPMLP